MPIVTITSLVQLDRLIAKSAAVVINFHAEWCGPCKQMAPIYARLSEVPSLARAGVKFTKVDVDEHPDVAAKYEVNVMPTFVVQQKTELLTRIKGADPRKLSEAVKRFVGGGAPSGASAGAGAGEGSSSGAGNDNGATAAKGFWLGKATPRSYSNVTDEVEQKNLDLLNADSEFGPVRTLFDSSKPSSLDKGKSSSSGEATEKKDWVESDTDEQLMLYIPFNSTVKVHSIQLTSILNSEGDDDEERPARPKTIKVYSNTTHVLGFEEAEDVPVTQEVTVEANHWDAQTHTAELELRLVKFQNVTSLVLFVVDGDGDVERVRLDRVRILGETGGKRVTGKLQKVGDEPGE